MSESFTTTQYIGLWIFEDFIQTTGDGVEEHFRTPEAKFEFINYTFHDEIVSHNIRLLHAEQSDEGLYICTVQGRRPRGQGEKQLDLGE